MKIIKTETGEFEYHNNDDMMAWLKAKWEKSGKSSEAIKIMAKHILADKPDKNAAENVANEILRMARRSSRRRI